jgi:ribonuclease HI
MPISHPVGVWVAHIDGASRGNPGPASCAVVIEAGGHRVTAFAQYLGRATNNFAEYQALLSALTYGLEHQQRRMQVESDSELLVRQIQGIYKIKSPDLKPLAERARELIGRYESFSIKHVRREQNREADRLANQSLDDAAQR